MSRPTLDSATGDTPLERVVNHYRQTFDIDFVHAQGSRLQGGDGRDYVDFYTARGRLNYGHDYISEAAEAPTPESTDFLARFRETILQPRGLDYRIAHAGRTGSDSVQSALELARRITGRANVIPFTNGEQDASLSTLANAGNDAADRDDETKLDDSVFIPFNHFYGDDDHSVEQLQTMIASNASAVDQPAAVIVETVQSDGGLYTADAEWLRQIEEICRDNGVLLVIDEVQTGCGRTGPFFSFEPAGIQPDIICLSRTISGSGLPIALTLVRPEHQESDGDFADADPALASASASLRFWETDELERDTARKSAIVREALAHLAETYPALAGEVRGSGLIMGLATGPAGLAAAICKRAREDGLLVETTGPRDDVVKLMPPLTIAETDLRAGLSRLDTAIRETLKTFQPSEDVA